MRVYAIVVDGSLYLGADLLSDMGPGGTYEAAADLLSTLSVVDAVTPAQDETQP